MQIDNDLYRTLAMGIISTTEYLRSVNKTANRGTLHEMADAIVDNYKEFDILYADNKPVAYNGVRFYDSNYQKLTDQMNIITQQIALNKLQESINCASFYPNLSTVTCNHSFCETFNPIDTSMMESYVTSKKKKEKRSKHKEPISETEELSPLDKIIKETDDWLNKQWLISFIEKIFKL